MTESRKTKLKADHCSTLASMSNLAYIWKGQGRHETVSEVMREYFKRRTHKLGAN